MGRREKNKQYNDSNVRATREDKTSRAPESIAPILCSTFCSPSLNRRCNRANLESTPFMLYYEARLLLLMIKLHTSIDFCADCT